MPSMNMHTAPKCSERILIHILTVAEKINFHRKKIAKNKCFAKKISKKKFQQKQILSKEIFDKKNIAKKNVTKKSNFRQQKS